MTQQPLDGPTLRVVEILPDGSKIPFPNQDWADGPDTGKVGIAATIGVASDKSGVVWILDMGSKNSPAQIVAWDTQKNQLHKHIILPKNVVTDISFLQDFALDEKRNYLYIADMTFPAPGAQARPAFVIVNLSTGSARRVLEGVSSLMPVNKDIVIDGSLVGTKVEGGKNALANAHSDDSSLANKIERYAPKPPSDGFIVDGKGRIFVSDIIASAVGISTPDGYQVIAKDNTLLSWPDGFALGPDGSLYVTQNQLHAHPALNEGKDESEKPYYVLKLSFNN